MKKQNINTKHSSEICDWLFNSPDLDAISYYADFNEKTKKWHCKLLDINFLHISRCKKCMKCQKYYKKRMSVIDKFQEDEYFDCFDDELFDDETGVGREEVEEEEDSSKLE